MCEKDQAYIDKVFTYHAPKDGQVEIYTHIRDYAKRYSTFICDSIPDSRERSVALTKLEECVMWANAAVARNI